MGSSTMFSRVAGPRIQGRRSLRNPGVQWGALTREVPLLRMLWVRNGHRPWHWDYVCHLAVAGTMCMGKVFSNRKALHGSCSLEQQPCLKDTCIHLERPPPE